MDSNLLALAGLAALLTITPGPDTMLILRNVMARGRLAGAATGAGACCGLSVHATLSAFGLSAILLYSATAFTIMKLLGALYLVYLGTRTLWDAYRTHTPVDATICEGSPLLRGGRSQLRKSWTEGFISNVLNPKVVVFYLAILPQAIADHSKVVEQSLLFAAIHFGIAIVYCTGLSFCLGSVRSVLLKPAFKKKLETVTGGIMVVFGLRLAAEQAP